MDIEIDEITRILSGVKIFQGLDADTVSAIAEQIQLEEFSKGQMLVEQGQVGKKLYIIFKGRVEVRVPDQSGDIHRRITLKKGSVVGEISLLINFTYTSNIIALTETVALYLNRERFLQLIELYSEFAEIISQLMTKRMGRPGGINKVGRYDLTGILGEGTMATVYSAWDSVLEREVAIKMLKYKLAFSPDFLNRFEREAKIIAGLNHPNIIKVIEIIDEFSTRFIVMEKFEGQSLSIILKAKGGFGMPETRGILSQLASALQYAHGHGKNGIIHRDIKPSNIMIDRYRNIKLTDFGIAGPPQDKNCSIEGTPAYLAPEIINGDPVDGRADIYAFGVMAFHMLANRLPFMASTLRELLRMQLHRLPPDIGEFCPGIDTGFGELINKSLAKDPAERISDWEQIRKILGQVSRFNDPPLESGEKGIVIRLSPASKQQTEKMVQAIEDVLQDEGVEFSLEVEDGNGSLGAG